MHLVEFLWACAWLMALLFSMVHCLSGRFVWAFVFAVLGLLVFFTPVLIVLYL